MGPFSAKPQPTAQPSGDGGLARACRQALLVPRSSLRIQTEVRHTQENKNRRTGSKASRWKRFPAPRRRRRDELPNRVSRQHRQALDLVLERQNCNYLGTSRAAALRRASDEPTVSEAGGAGLIRAQLRSPKIKSRPGWRPPPPEEQSHRRPETGDPGWRLTDGD